MRSPHPSFNKIAMRNWNKRDRGSIIAMSNQSYDSLSDDLRAGGFDLFVPMRVAWYNDYLQKLGLATDSTSYLEKSGETHASGEGNAFKLASLPDYGRQGNALAFFVGNSKAIWPKFLRWLKDQPNAAAMKDPVDAYTSKFITDAMNKFAAAEDNDDINSSDSDSESKKKDNKEEATTSSCAKEYEAFWASDMSPDRLVDMNRVALVTQTCYFSEKLFLSIHPIFGSWVAFRAVVVFDASASHLDPVAVAPPFLQSSSLLSDEEAENARIALEEALRASSEQEFSVDGMSLELATKWAKMRDCVSLGREYKYSSLQSEYHYTKNPKILLRAISEDLH